MSTEGINAKSVNLDMLPSNEILSILHGGHMDALNAVAGATVDIGMAAQLQTHALKNDGRIVYAAAGSSAFMALADGLELPGTFGIDDARIKFAFAGRIDSQKSLTNHFEDDVQQAVYDIEQLSLKTEDCLIALSASGSTPYTLAALKTAQNAGANTIAIANNPGSPLFSNASVKILIETPPEIVSGSTRLGAATAQKAVLNMMSTLMAIKLGHVYDGYMVDVGIDNSKLHSRAITMISCITNCSRDNAAYYLNDAGGSAKIAILLASGVKDSEAARKLLKRNGGQLRKALAECVI